MPVLSVASAIGPGSHVATLAGRTLGALFSSPGSAMQLAALAVVVLLASLFDSM